MEGVLTVTLTSAALGACRGVKALHFFAGGTRAQAPLPLWWLLCTDCNWDRVRGVVRVGAGLLWPVRGAEFSMAVKQRVGRPGGGRGSGNGCCRQCSLACLVMVVRTLCLWAREEWTRALRAGEVESLW